MRRKKRPPGFTLTELVIALSLAAFVLVGIVSVAAQMIRFQMEGKTKGDVTGWTLLSLNRMHKELEDASVLAYPTTTGDHISGCSNYSRVTNAALDPGKPITAFWYCVAAGSPPKLVRYFAVGSCPMTVLSCGSGTAEIYALDFYPIGAAPLFRRVPEGVELNYNVGVAAATPQRPMPVYQTVRTRISMNKTYGNTAD